jgi:hypothetical protein
MDNNNNEIFISQIETPTDRIELSKVGLQRQWVFWENYEAKQGGDRQLDWSQMIKKIFTFNDIISFWQFWNDYPGSNPSNIFYNGERVR